MPVLSTGLTGALARLGQTQQRLGLPSSTSAFQNNITSANKRDPGVSARTAIARPQIEEQRDAQQVAYRNKLDEVSNWSKRQTGIVQAGAMARRAKQAAEQQARQVRVSQPGQSIAQSPAGGQSQTPQNYASYNGGGSGARNKIVQTALSYVGTPYAWGGGSATVRTSRGIGLGTQNVIGVDCSGLTSFAYNSVGVRIPRHSNTQTSFGVKTSLQNARPGDIIGWARGGHVAIYIGNGQIVESPKPGTRVRVRQLGANERAYAVRLQLPGE